MGRADGDAFVMTTSSPRPRPDDPEPGESARASYLVGPVLDGAFFEALVDQAPDGLVAVDPSGRIAFANRRAAEMFGDEPGELRGEPVELLVPVASRDRH